MFNTRFILDLNHCIKVSRGKSSFKSLKSINRFMKISILISMVLQIQANYITERFASRGRNNGHSL